MSFAFNNANELPMPIDNRTNDMSAGLEYANTTGMIRVGWDGSWFNNNIKSIVWDNPLRITDTNPFDPSGYSNGNGPATGRMSVPPSNTMNTISATGLYKLPSHTTINGTVSFNAMSQNDALLPWTTNRPSPTRRSTRRSRASRRCRGRRPRRACTASTRCSTSRRGRTASSG